MARDPRYALLLAPPATILAVIGLFSLAQWLSARTEMKPSWLLRVGLAATLGLHLWAAPRVLVPAASGFQEVVAFLKDNAPDARIFYDGLYNGIFSFYLRAGDPEFKRGVVLGSKLLYASSIDPRWHLTERVSSPSDVVEVLQKECGCPFVIVENPVDLYRGPINAVMYLRDAVKGPEFELVKSFPLHIVEPPHAGVHDDDVRLDVYRLRVPFDTPSDLEFRFPILGDGAVFRAKPIR
jgi:hypothetical protein